jgi:hypothetical protein
MLQLTKKAIQSILKRFGMRLVRDSNITQTGVQASGEQWVYALDRFFALLKGEGFHPRHIVDVGANRGLWTRGACQQP